MDKTIKRTYWVGVAFLVALVGTGGANIGVYCAGAGKLINAVLAVVNLLVAASWAVALYKTVKLAYNSGRIDGHMEIMEAERGKKLRNV